MEDPAPPPEGTDERNRAVQYPKRRAKQGEPQPQVACLLPHHNGAAEGKAAHLLAKRSHDKAIDFIGTTPRREKLQQELRKENMKAYMDHSATTPAHPEVVQAMLPYHTEHFGNASSLHAWGANAARALTAARESVASLINAEPKEIIFTSGGSESDNLAIKGALAAHPNKKHIITTAIEHHAVHETCEYLQKNGIEVTFLPVDSKGIVDPEAVSAAIRDDTAMVSVMHANNETGAIQPIEAISRICKERLVLFHTDAVQTVGKIEVDVKKLGVDLLSASGHKFYGPKGTGFLYVKKGTRLLAQIHGGSHESGLRAGTENIPGIVGLAKACELAKKDLPAYREKLNALSGRLLDGILEMIPKATLNGPKEGRIPGTFNVRFAYIEGEALIIHLDEKGVAASTGSACSTKSLEPSHVLTAMGIPKAEAHGSLRISLGRSNDESQVDYLLKVLPPIVEGLRKISPLYEGE